MDPIIPKYITISWNKPRPNLLESGHPTKYEMFPHAPSKIHTSNQNIIWKIIFNKENIIDYSPTTNLGLKGGFSFPKKLPQRLKSHPQMSEL